MDLEINSSRFHSSTTYCQRLLFGDKNNFKPVFLKYIKGKGKVYPCTGTEALYRPYGPLGVVEV